MDIFICTGDNWRYKRVDSFTKVILDYTNKVSLIA